MCLVRLSPLIVNFFPSRNAQCRRCPLLVSRRGKDQRAGKRGQVSLCVVKRLKDGEGEPELGGVGGEGVVGGVEEVAVEGDVNEAGVEAGEAAGGVDEVEGAGGEGANVDGGCASRAARAEEGGVAGDLELVGEGGEV